MPANNIDPVHFVKPQAIKFAACGVRAAMSRTTRHPEKVTCPACCTHVRKVEAP